jgi:endonuclease/exonuclease/phosphatase family metal-dependent hydrolase
VDFVPVPVRSPLGRINSGIVSLSKPGPYEVVRNAYGGNYSWPTSLFMLDRCYLVNRYALPDGRDFILINTHNSAYDDGSLRAKQLQQLEEFVLTEHEKGNPVVIGGDWNQSPTGFSPAYKSVFDTTNLSFLPAEFLPGWKQVFSDSIPTNRRITTPYSPSGTPTTVIDFFIISPGVEVYDVRTLDLKFRHSDHQPVLLTFRLKKMK